MPTRPLPENPNLAHLKHQALDLLHAFREGDPIVLERLRQFHPDLLGERDSAIAAYPLKLAGAQLAIAREYGFASWARLKRFVLDGSAETLRKPHHERIPDPAFRAAVDAMDAGDVECLKALLEAHPNLVHRRVFFEGGNYFSDPTLLEFIAENPIRHGRVPESILAVAECLLEAGARHQQRSMDGALELVASGRVVREAGVQVPLIELLCANGAAPSAAMMAALGHREMDAVKALLRCGAAFSIEVAAALGDVERMLVLLPGSDGESRHRALALAAIHSRPEALRALLEAGEDPNRYNPSGFHSHSTPLHQAAWNGDLRSIEVLLSHGADRSTKDLLFGGTPAGWAAHAGNRAAEERLGAGC